jgi:MerR family transcriptional regulator, copper efflux regulator
MDARQLPLLKIGELATRSGVPIKTIRYYEELGLVQNCGRTEGQFRLFHPDILTRLAFIKRLQSLGLSLQEIGRCLAVYDRGELPCGDVKNKLEAKVIEIDRQIAELNRLRHELTDVLQQWAVEPDRQDEVICPNLQV